MNEKLRILASGQLTSSWTDVYVVPVENVRAILVSIRIVSLELAGRVGVKILKANGIETHLIPPIFSLGAGYTLEVLEEHVGLESGDKVQARGDINNNFDFWINGEQVIL